MIVHERIARYFIVEFNETCQDKGIRKYDGRIVTPTLISELELLDESVKENDGYYKFYFDEITNGETTNHFRICMGDGFEKNKKYYEALRIRTDRVQCQKF